PRHRVEGRHQHRAPCRGVRRPRRRAVAHGRHLVRQPVRPLAVRRRGHVRARVGAPGRAPGGSRPGADRRGADHGQAADLDPAVPRARNRPPDRARQGLREQSMILRGLPVRSTACAAMLVVACAPPAQRDDPAPPGEVAAVPAPPPAQPGGAGMVLAAPEEVGMDADRLARADSAIAHAVLAGATPGAALAVGRHGRLVRLSGYGRLDWRGGFGLVTDSTIYDLASLSKVIGTTTAAMILVQEGKLDLDAPVSRYLDEWHGKGDKQRVTVRHLLMHSSGLPAYAPLWRELRGRDAYARRIGGMGLDYTPGSRTVYSDFGIMVLGFIIEELSGQTLDLFLDERVFD